MQVPWRSFTQTANGTMNVLTTDCGVSAAFHPLTGGNAPPVCPFTAIWDTGATNSAITQAAIDGCGLVATGMAQVHGVHGMQQVETYLVNIHLPNKVAVSGVRVTKGQLPGADVLIGMDVISMGDFAVTNLGGITQFSFRIPSQVHVDFGNQQKKQSPTPQAQNRGKAAPRTKHPKTFGKNKKRK
ncbi:MAG: retroviral-like aspartic protease family protein [Candidatus Marsarchaeota archaeon]|nr:retroviral-like aspartic protease family protein [Candidatus Marsarchaeota archaeon]